MGYIGVPYISSVTPSYPKEDFIGSSFGVVNGFSNAVELGLIVQGFNPSNCEVFIDNVQQEPFISYYIEPNVSNEPKVLRFTSAIDPLSSVYVIYKKTGDLQVATPPDQSVGKAQLASELTSFTIDSFTGDGVTSIFTMTEEPYSANSVIVTVDGLIQKPSLNYSVSAFNLTFTSAPINNAEIEIRHLSFRTTFKRALDYQVDVFTGNGVLSSFTLSTTVNTNSAFVTINGVTQTPSTAYNIAGTTLTFTGVPGNGDEVVVRYQI